LRSTAASSKLLTRETETLRRPRCSGGWQIDESIARYLSQVDSADRQVSHGAKITRLNEKIATLRDEIKRLNALNARMIQTEALRNVAVALLYSPRKPIGNQKSLFRVEIVFLGFYSMKYLICGFSVCSDIIIMPEHEGGWCYLHCLKWLSNKIRKKLSICKT
jgi:hypothetical protein